MIWYLRIWYHTVSNYCAFVACATARENSPHVPQAAKSTHNELPRSHASRKNKTYCDKSKM